MNQENPSAVLQADSDIHDDETTANIGLLDVSETWKERFRAIHNAGGPTLPHFKKLERKERSKAQGFNILAFFFGPLYYMAKGMWRKGIVILVLGLAIVLTIEYILIQMGYGEASKALKYGIGAACAAMANRDYYRKMVLRQNGWWW